MKGIPMKTWEVRAILDGRKIVTRRVVKQYHVDKFVIGRDGALLGSFDGREPYPTVDDCHYQPGDILYVQETYFEYREHIHYKADGKYEALSKLGIQFKWRPSIHMPKKAARLFLRVTGVRVERLLDMQPYDIAFEGFRRERDFKMLWNSTIKPKDRALYGWEVNPWVWVIEFERISKEEAENRV